MPGTTNCTRRDPEAIALAGSPELARCPVIVMAGDAFALVNYNHSSLLNFLWLRS
jgi:hypothetical protein